MIKQIALSGAAAALAFSGLTESALAATMFRAVLDGAQVAVPGGVTTPASGWASFELNEDQNELRYTIDLDGLVLKPDISDRTAANDVTKIHIHFGAPGNNGPHTLNIFGLPREDDDDLGLDLSEGILTGIWDDGDAINPDTGSLFDPTMGGTTKTLSSFVDELIAGQLYLQVHTVASDQAGTPGEIRGQIESVPEPATVLGLMLTAGVGLGTLRKARTLAG